MTFASLVRAFSLKLTLISVAVLLTGDTRLTNIRERSLMATAREGGRGFGHRTTLAPSTYRTAIQQRPKVHSNSKAASSNTNSKSLATPTTSTQPYKTVAPANYNKDDQDSDQDLDNRYLYDWEAALLKRLFAKNAYNNDVRPAKSNSQPVYVTLELVLLQINDLIDKEQQIVISGFLKINWDDERLTWESSEYGDITWIVTSARNVWLPDIALINSDDVYAVTRDGRFPVTITSTGQILYVPAGKIHARCELDLRFFPFDDQLCTYRFESWVYAAELVQITGINFTIDRNHYVDNHQWEIRDSFVHTRIVNYENFNFSRVEFYMLMRRKSLFFITYTIFPCLALSTLQIFSHMLPFTESERINFATTTLIAFSVFHVSIVEQMPQSSHAIPLLAIYIDALMCLIGLSLLECFLMMNWLSKVGCSVPSPRLWYYVVDKWGDYMFLGSNGTYWRRNYLRILEEVNAKEAQESRRKAYERKRWSSTSRKHQENYIRKWSNYGARTQSAGEIQALIHLMDRWGYSFGNKQLLRRKISLLQATESPSTETSPTRKSHNKHGFHTVDEMDKFASFSSIRLSSIHPKQSAGNNNNDDDVNDEDNDNEKMPVKFNIGAHISGGSNKIRSSRSHHDVAREDTRRSFNNFDNEDDDDNDGEQRRTTPGTSRRHRHHHRRPCAGGVSADQIAGLTAPSSLAQQSPLPQNATSSPFIQQQTQSSHSSSAHHYNQHHSHLPTRFSQMTVGDDSCGDLSTIAGATTGVSRSSQRQHRSRSSIKHKQQQQQQQQQQATAGPSPGGNNRQTSVVNFDFETQQQETKLLTPRLERGRSESIGATNTNYLIQHDRKLQLSALDDIRQLIDDVNSSLSSHTLRRECIGVWTTFITVIDRIMSLFLMILCISMPTYLFAIFPQPMDLTKLKSTQHS